MSLLQQRIFLFALLFKVVTSDGMGVITQSAVAKYVCQNVIPAGVALLANQLTKFDANNLVDLTASELQKINTTVNSSQPCILSPHVMQNFFLSPIYYEALKIKNLAFTPKTVNPEFQGLINIYHPNVSPIKRVLYNAYLKLCEGDFCVARQIIRPYLGSSQYRDHEINQLFAAFSAIDFSEHNILIKYEHDPLWANLNDAQRHLIANNQTLRDTINLELSLRHELITKLQQELGLNNLNYNGLHAYLISLMHLSPEQKFRILLSLKPDHNLRQAFYNNNGLLKAFNKLPYTNIYRLPTTLTPTQSALHLKRMNELLFYNQNCRNNDLFVRAANAITDGLTGNIYFAHLAYSAISPTFMPDFIAELDLITAHMQAQKDKSQLPHNPNENPDGLQDPNDPEHKKEILAFLAVAQDKSEELMDVLNKKLYDLGVGFYLRAINLFHTFHGDAVNNYAPTGCHSYWGRCCFGLKQIKNWGDNKFSICNIIKNNLSKPSSSMFPSTWSLEKVMDKLIAWAQSGKIVVSNKQGDSPIRIFHLIKTCCKNNIEFRAKISNGVGNIDSFYPFIKDFVINNINDINCNCMK